MTTPLKLMAVLGVLLLAGGATAAPDLLKERNGGFEHGLTNWLVHFPEHDFLKNNVACVSVVRDGSRPHVLKLVLSPAAASTAAPALSSMLIYLLMAVILVVRPAGLFPAATR